LPLLLEAVEAWTVGDPVDPGTRMGPLVSADHREAVARYLESGMGDPDSGPVVPAFSGRVPAGPGFWFPPTVVAPAGADWRLAREEIFGPVLAVIPFGDEEDAVRMANATPYGLSGSIWTRDGARALRMARAVDSGNLSVNSNSSVRVQTAFGGRKQSGLGRELGLEALDSYTEVKTVFVSDSG
ncbi:MAG TPA: aldehyde dehydrogenase family protein, partial [Acidimicrobiales bacterium]|nr:aldehyde dehydrogenase family protein [Acidimicrobiales bacterium]